MLLEKISVDIIYIIVDYLNGCNISKFTNTSKDINNLVNEQKESIWLKLLSKKHLNGESNNLPNQVIRHFHFKTRSVLENTNINSNYIKYASHYFCSKYIIIHLRKEIIKNYKYMNTILFYGPSLINDLYKSIYGSFATIVNTKEAENSFKRLNINLLRDIKLNEIDVINTISNIHSDLYYVAKVLQLINKNRLTMDYIIECFNFKNGKETCRRFTKRINYLSKLCTLCYYSIDY